MSVVQEMCVHTPIHLWLHINLYIISLVVFFTPTTVIPSVFCLCGWKMKCVVRINICGEVFHRDSRWSV